MIGLKKWVLAMILFSASWFLYSYNISNSHVYHTDIGRDANEIARLAQGDITLVGPKLSFGGVHAGPYYYYLFAPILFLSNFDLNLVLVFNTFLFSLALTYFYKKAIEKYSIFWGAVSTIILIFAPIYHLISRNPGNAYTFIPFLLILLSYLFFNKLQHTREYLFLGILSGIIINFHPLNLIVIAALSYFVFQQSRNNKLFIFYLAGAFITFFPLILFELRNNFVIFNKTYFDFLNGNLPLSPYGQEEKQTSLVSNYLNARGDIKKLILFPPIVYLVFFIIPYFKYFKIKRNQAVTFFSIASIICLVSYVLAFKGNIGPHYIFSFAYFLFFTITIFILKYNLKIFALVIIVLEIIFFQGNLYDRSTRSSEKFKSAVNYVIENKLVTKSDSFNLIQTVENVPAGHEYRFFFRANGFKPKTINEYAQSNVLLVFDESRTFDINDLKNWETSQFGQKFIDETNVNDNGEIIIYSIRKN